ncbi:MAG: PhzF family phenazine biosynthesis protein [Rhizobiales bacterium]|nr:PhzF family phenazine biosynthesis protein [Hyphomicrobiales bacterium]
MPLRYAILDVFTDRPLAGNPLAVVLDADGLGDQQMQAIAGEFNLSETVFLEKTDNPVHAGRARIFTPRHELPFAGHPTVGTAVLLGIERMAGAAGSELMLMLEEKVGLVRCGVTVKSARAGHAVFDVPSLPKMVQAPLPADRIASALGLTASELGLENHVVTAFSAGVPFAFVPVRDMKAIARARPVMSAWGSAFGDLLGAFLYCREATTNTRQFHARMFAPGAGIVEDPATGSAVAALAGVIAKFDQPPGGGHRYIIEQGFEMGRPSVIGLEIDMDGGEVAAARISGDAVIVGRGTLDV